MHTEKKDKEKFPIIHRAALLCFGKVGSGHGSPQHSTPAKGSFICNPPKLCMSVSWCYWKDRAHMSLEVFLAALRLLELFSKSYSCHSLNCLGDGFPTLGLSEGFWVCLWYSARHDCWDLCLLHMQKPLSRSTDPPSRNLSATFLSQQEKAWLQIPKLCDRREWRVFQHLGTARGQS